MIDLNDINVKNYIILNVIFKWSTFNDEKDNENVKVFILYYIIRNLNERKKRSIHTNSTSTLDRTSLYNMEDNGQTTSDYNVIYEYLRDIRLRHSWTSYRKPP